MSPSSYWVQGRKQDICRVWLYGKDMGNWCQKKGKPYPAPAEQERAVNPCKDVLAAQGRDGE